MKMLFTCGKDRSYHGPQRYYTLVSQGLMNTRLTAECRAQSAVAVPLAAILERVPRFKSTRRVVDVVPNLATRLFRLWDYVWLYHFLGLSEGGKTVLDLGGFRLRIGDRGGAGNDVHTVDLNPRIVRAPGIRIRARRRPTLRASPGCLGSPLEGRG